MTGPLLLALTLAILLLVIKLEGQAKPAVSTASWITFIWVVLSSIRPISYFLYPDQHQAFQSHLSWQQGAVDLIQSNPLERNLRIFLMLVALVVLYKRRNRFALHFGENAWLSVFYLLAFASIFWAGYPDIALKRWIRLAGDGMIALLLLTEDDPARTLERIIWRTAAILLPLSILLVKYSDRLGRIYTPWGTQMWVGVTGHKNSLGELCAYTGVVLVWRCLKKWPKVEKVDVLLLAINAYLLIGSKSSTSAIIFVVGIFIMAVQFLMKRNAKKLNRVLIITLISVLLLQGLTIAFMNSSLVPLFFSVAGRDSSFTGRVPLWQELIGIGFTRPIWGFGFMSFWLDNDAVSELYEKVRWTPTNAHNGYIDIFLNQGLIGFFILLLLLIQSYKNILMNYERNHDWGTLKVAFFMMVILHNFTESTMGMPNSMLWLLLLFSGIIVRTKAYSNQSGH